MNRKQWLGMMREKIVAFAKENDIKNFAELYKKYPDQLEFISAMKNKYSCKYILKKVDPTLVNKIFYLN